MITPNKAVTYSESLMSRFPIILRELKKNSISVSDLYSVVNNRFTTASEFLLVLDCLFILGRIELSDGVLRYVNRDQM